MSAAKDPPGAAWVQRRADLDWVVWARWGALPGVDSAVTESPPGGGAVYAPFMCLPLAPPRVTVVLWLPVVVGCADPLVRASSPDALPVDVSRIDHALVARAEVLEGHAWEVWTSDMWAADAVYTGDAKAEGAAGHVYVLLTGDDVGCGELVEGAPPGGTEGLILGYHWWTTDAELPDWAGEYPVAGAEGGGVLRVGVVGSWDTAGVWRWDGLEGGLHLGAWSEELDGGAEIGILEASFDAESCVEAP